MDQTCNLTSNLQFHPIADSLEVRFGRNFWQSNVHRSSNGGAEVCWTEGEPTKSLITTERRLGTYQIDTLKGHTM